LTFSKSAALNRFRENIPGTVLIPMSSLSVHSSRNSSVSLVARIFFPAALLLLPVSAATPVRAQTASTVIRVDASQPWHEPGPADYKVEFATAPSGDTLGLNDRNLTLNGKPWLPVAGEFHFSRFPREQWEDELLKMKASGVNVVTAYVIWIHHEEIKGRFDWQGQRDLRAFAQLCARHGLYLVVRIGPWDHAEVRNGGLPDWVMKQGPTRVNDPVYLASVREWYGQIGSQLNGLLWKEGGPVIGIQLENEYSKRGPGAGEEHILVLKHIALTSGLEVPLYVVTGWDNAAIPLHAVVPVYGGGYPDEPWDGSLVKLKPAQVYAFRFHSRVNSDAKPVIAGDPPASDQGSLPYLTIEIGGGIEDTYHRRPVIAADDIDAQVPVMLGSGVNFYGTYMFQGGENPDGALTTLQESQETGYPNDLPIKSYDFQAPLGEFGEERASLRKLKIFNYFMNEFGADLAPMQVHAPKFTPADSSDLSIPRASVRSHGDSGFIFFNNYVRGYAMPARPASQFEIHLPSGTLTVPRHPVDLPSGAYFIWPFNFQLSDVTLRYSTAQLFTHLENDGEPVFYFEAQPGIPVEIALDAATVKNVSASSGQVNRDGSTIYISAVAPGLDASIDILSTDGHRIRLAVLTQEQAEDAWKVSIGSADHLLISDADFSADTDSSLGRIWLRSRTSSQIAFTLVPPPAAPLKSSLSLTATDRTATSAGFAADAANWTDPFECVQTEAAGLAPPVKTGPALDWRPRGVAEAPGAGPLANAARWSITVPAGSMNGLSDLYLKISYTGDVARLYSGGRLIDDNFYNGKPWTIGLKRFLATRGPSTFELSVLPLRKDAPVYLETATPPEFAPNGQAIGLEGVTLVPEYQLEIDTTAH
jgi:beta-galactosidase